MTYLITGAFGQLGTEFVRYFQKHHIPFAAPPENQLDITDRGIIDAAVSTYKPSVIINCAAYNNVEKAEEDATTPNAVNGLAVKNLAETCQRNNIFLVHYGTDFVFDGKKKTPYKEEDPPNPLNSYGASKLKGERFLQRAGCNHLLFRVSWVFGPGKQNFLHKLQSWAAKNPVLRVVDDQISVPTYTGDIVAGTIKALEQGLEGLYHLTNSGCASRYDVARVFLHKIGYQGQIIPVPTSAFPSPVVRPVFSAMTNARLSEAIQTPFAAWEDAIARFSQLSEFQQFL